MPGKITDEEHNRSSGDLTPPAVEHIACNFKQPWSHSITQVLAGFASLTFRQKIRRIKGDLSSELLFHLRGQAKVLAHRIKGTNFVMLAIPQRKLEIVIDDR